jgi:hypothetical protein
VCSTHPALIRELEDALGARIHGLVNGVSEARDLSAGRLDRMSDLARLPT